MRTNAVFYKIRFDFAVDTNIRRCDVAADRRAVSSSAAGDAVQHSSLVGNVTPTIEETREDIMAGLMKSKSGFGIETVRLKVILTAVLFLFHLSQTSGKQ